MQSKALLIAIAAFAVTTTSVSAYGTTVLKRADLTDEQRTAFLEARELRENGDRQAARDVLVEAGITDETIESLRLAAKAAREEMKAALSDGDYESFVLLVAGTPLADIITTEADFERFKEAHILRQSGEREAAREILIDLGVDVRERGDKKHRKRVQVDLTDEQREALLVARQANDRETVRAILKEAGIERR